MFLMTFEFFFFFFFVRYDCNKRYIKTLEHLQIYFDRLCELSYKTGLIIFQSFIFVYFLTLELFWTLYIQTFFCFDVRFYGFFAQYVPKKFHKFIFSIYFFLPFALFIFEGYTSHIYLGPFVILQNSNFFCLFQAICPLYINCACFV